MLKRTRRLSSKFEFDVVRKYGKHYKSEFFHCYVLKPAKYLGDTKVGIVVSNKVHKKAAKRNRIKRVFREAVRNHYEKLGTNLWIVIQPTANAVDKNYEEISSDFNKTVQEISFPR